MKQYLLILMLFVLMPSATAQTLTPIQIDYKHSGYVLGDLLTTKSYFNLERNQKIDIETLPTKGPVTPWLDLRHVEYVQEGNRHLIVATWQIFATVENVHALVTPELQLRTTRPDSKIIKIPSVKFYVSPSLPVDLEGIQRYQSLPPALFNEGAALTYMVISFVSAIILIFVWLWLNDKIRWLPRNPKPFTCLVRRLKKQGVHQLTYFELSHLHLINHALNKCAEETLYPASLKVLFDRSHYLKADAFHINQYFDCAWKIFFENREILIPVDINMAWIERAAIAERITSLR